MLTGSRFLMNYRNNSSIAKTYANRITQVFTVPASEPSFVRFTTEKEVIHEGKKDKRACVAILDVVPARGETVRMTHPRR